MAALTATENANLVWQRVKASLAGANPAIQEAFRGLKLILATQYKNPNLQILQFAQADVAGSNTGAILGTGAPKIFAVYGKKGTVGTSAYLTICDSPTDAATGATHRIALEASGAGDEVVFIDTAPAAWITGVCVVSKTTLTGTTVSTGATTAFDGFLIVGGY